VSFRSTDGVELSGLYLPSTNGAAVISFPGPGALDHARMLARHGYGVLMFDQRGEGDSGGMPNALGWQAERDVRGAIAFLQHQPDVDPARIGGIGLSVGGETLLQTAAHTDALHAVVSDGAGVRSPREQRHVGGIAETVQIAAMTAGTALFSNSLPPADLKALAGQIESTPLFLIYSEHGQGGEQLSAEYAAAAKAPTTVWKVPDTKHTEGITTHPAEYERRVIAFLDDALMGR
jgi:predicted acyl esterase